MKPTERPKLGHVIRESRDTDRQLRRVLRFRRYLWRAKAGILAAAFLAAVLIAFGWGFAIALGGGALLLVLVEVFRRRNERQIARHDGAEL
jgi:hypothetical protein